jgi:hypothetical protein
LVAAPKASKRTEGALYFAGPGAGTSYRLPSGKIRERLSYLGYPDEMIETMGRTWSPAYRQVVERDVVDAGG